VVKFIILIIDDRWFKYNSILNSKNDTVGADYFDNNICLESHTCGDSQNKRQESRSFFREHYKKHSEQLIDALQNWENRLKFTSYKYNEGLSRPERIEPEYVPYMQQMKKHLDKAYLGLLPSPLDIETNRKNLCNQIQSLMIFKTDTIPSIASFEKIIIDRINTLCPTLTNSNDVELTKNNIYLEKYIFQIIFDAINRQESTLTLSIQGNRLLYENAKVLGQGDELSMNNLKLAIEELLVDKEIIARIAEYKNLINQLDNDEQINHLKSVVRVSYSYSWRTSVRGISLLRAM
jgi:hypothetical protein